ncbi:MAG: universal stress protein [Halorientalis sp.]
MEVLVPMDGSACSRRALEHAVGLVAASGGRVDVVHFTDVPTDATDELLARAEEILADAGVEWETEVVTDVRLSEPRSATHVGRRILERVEDGDYDLVVLGHHGTGVVGELLLGSTARTVVDARAVPVTVVP